MSANQKQIDESSKKSKDSMLASRIERFIAKLQDLSDEDHHLLTLTNYIELLKNELDRAEAEKGVREAITST